MKFLKAIRNGCLIPFIAICGIGWLSSYLYTYHYWSGGIPEDISVGRKLQSETPFIISPGGSTGYAVFKLKKSTAHKIEKTNINYFINKTEPRRWNSGIKWVETGNDSSLNFYAGFKQKYENTIREAFKTEGNFFGFYSKNTRILIIPSDQIVIIGYWD